LADLQKGHILIVDDNPYNLEVLSRRLERKGFSTICVDNGERAIELVETQKFDLMLLDIMMPGLQGTEVLSFIRKKYTKSELPIIMVTSKGESEDVVDSLNLGANDYIVKPVDFPVALARIQAAVQQRREIDGIQAATSQSASFEEGGRFGNYQIKSKIGQGGMGAVYKVYDAALDRHVALKVVLPSHELSPSQKERFIREARAIAKIRHPNIVSVYEIGEKPQSYFTMDLIEGQNLGEIIKAARMDIKRACRITAKLASALHEAHAKGIVHRDLKPSNIMINEADEPLLMDFGLAKMETEEEQLTRTGDILGTPEYMSPEQIDPNFGEIDGRSDLYSLGVILYEMLTGLPPYSGTPIRVLWQKLNQLPTMPVDLNGEISKELQTVCMKAMEKTKSDRFQDGNAFESAIKALGL
jgi:CheY-like chemotaxis protein